MVKFSVPIDYFLHPNIKAAEITTKEAIHAEKSTIDLIQKSCDHRGYIAEAPYKESTWCSDADPPFRVCLRCGVLEHGWGTGYKILKMDLETKPMEITRDEGYKARKFGNR